MRKRDPKARPKYRIKSAGGDRPSTRKSDFKKAAKYKTTPRYRSDVRRAATKKTRVQSVPVPVYSQTRRGGTSPTVTTTTIRRKVEFPRSQAERSARVKRIKSKPVAKRTVEDLAVLHDHESKVARNKVLKRGRARFTGAPSTRERAAIRRFEVKDFLSKRNQDRLLKEQTEKELSGPRLLPGTRIGEKAQQAGLSVQSLTTQKDPHTLAKEKTSQRLAEEGFKKGASISQVNKALMSLDTRHKAPGLVALEQLTRPISGVAGGAKAIAKGESPLGIVKAMGKGVASNKESFSKIIAGKDKKAGAVEIGAGLALDIALDPTTYLTFGASRPALEAARIAAKQAAEEALERGVSSTLVQRAAKQAADAAYEKTAKRKSPGIKVGLRGTPVRAGSILRQSARAKPLSQGERALEVARASKGRTGLRRVMAVSGANVRASRLGQAAQRSTREVSTSGGLTSRGSTGAVEFLRKRGMKTPEILDSQLQAIVHSYRPRRGHVGDRGFSEVEWEFMRAGAREYRAGMAIAERVGERRMQAYRQMLKDNDIPDERHRAIIDAIEVGKVDKLKAPGERAVARAIQRDYKSMAKAKARAGVAGEDEVIRDRAGDVDVPEVPDVKQSQKDLGKARRAATAAEKEVRAAELELSQMQGRAEVLSRNVSGVRGERAAQRAGKLLAAPARGVGDLPPVPPGHVRLYRGEGVAKREGEDWFDAPEGQGPSQGRWFTEDLERAEGYSKGFSGERHGYVKYIDVPEDVARAAKIRDDKAAGTYVLPDDVASGAAELTPGASQKARAEWLKRARAADRTPEIRARRREARAKLMGESAPRYAGGGHGVEQAKLRLAEAEAKRAEAMLALASQRKNHDTVKGLAQEARAARKRADQLAAEARGYVQRKVRPDYIDESGERPFDKVASGGFTPALHRRRNREPLAQQDPERRDMFIQDVPQLMGESTAETQRLKTIGAFNDRAAALGRRLQPGDDIDLNWMDPVDLQRFYIRTERGALKPVYRVVDTTSQLDARIAKMLDEGEEIIEVPKSTLVAMQHLAKRGRRPSEVGPMAVFDEVTRKWKWLVTQPNPGYHVRNLMGDFWNARLGGATMRDVSGAAKMIAGARRELDGLSKLMYRGIAEEPDLEKLAKAGSSLYYKGLGRQAYDAEVVLLAERHGVVRMGFAGNEMRQLAKGNELKERGKVMRGLQSFNESREDIMRLASFMRALRRGDSPEAAASWANKHHFDYGDLTDTEVRKLRRIMPFYTFMARNTPLQMASLIQTPGRFASFEKTRQASAEAAGIDPKWLEKMPEYLQAQLPFAIPRIGPKTVGTIPGLGPVPGNQTQGLPMLAAPMLPVTDLNLLPVGSDALNQWSSRLISSITPMIKLPAELALKYDTFYRDKIRKDLVPAPVWMESKDMQDTMRLLGAIPGVGEPTFDKIWDRRTGKKVIAWPWWMDKLARSTPITGLVAGTFTEGREKRPGDRSLTLTNWATGVRRAAIDPTEARTSSLFDELEEIDAELNLAKQRRHKPQGTEFGGRLKDLSERKAEIQEELNKATSDFAVPYFERGGKKKGGRKKSNPYATSGAGANPYAPGGAKDNPYK